VNPVAQLCAPSHAPPALLQLLLVCALLGPGTADAHDGSFFGVRPFSDAGDFVGGGTTYGLVLVEDGRNLWTCLGAVGATPFWWHWVSAERVLMGTNEGIRISQDGGCTWTVPVGLAGELTSFSIAPRPNLSQELVATTGASEAANHVLRSVDGGLSWDSILRVEDADIWRTVWNQTGTELIAEVVHPGGVTVLQRSVDAGESWLATLLHLGDWRSVGLFGPSLDAQFLWLTALSPEGEFVLGRVQWDLGSELEPLRAFPNLITAFVEEEDQLHIVVSFAEYMTWTGLPEDEPAATSGAVSTCLYGLDGLLWGCGGEPMRAQFSRRTAAGDWEELIRLADIEPRTCPEGSPGAALCPLEWKELQGELNVGLPPGDDDDGGGEAAACAGCDDATAPVLGLLGLLGFLLPLGRRTTSLRRPRSR
jgi:hypothetical protein